MKLMTAGFTLILLALFNGPMAFAQSVASSTAKVETQPAIAATPAMPKMPDMPHMPDMPKMPSVPGIQNGTPPIPATSGVMHDMMHMMPVPANASPATKAFIETNTKMHQGMAIQFSDNVDADFVKGMIPHHQGAVDMAKIELQYGKDPAIKKFAEDIISAQTNEIDFMKNWLAKNVK